MPSHFSSDFLVVPQRFRKNFSVFMRIWMEEILNCPFSEKVKFYFILHFFLKNFKDIIRQKKDLKNLKNLKFPNAFRATGRLQNNVMLKNVW